jgi:tetratricopeptide (TPR) repeat protein/CHAT domain-containing protein
MVRRGKFFIWFFVLVVLLVIPALMVIAEAPVSLQSQADDQEKDRTIESIIKLTMEYRKAGKYEEAVQQLNKALDKFHKKEYQEKLRIELADVHILWADSLEKKYDHANAIKHYEMAYAIDKNYRPKKAAGDLNKIGFLYDALDQMQKALEYYEKAIPISQALGDRAEETEALNNIGTVYYALGQMQKALEFYEKALTIRKAVGDRAGEATTLNNIGAVYYALGQMQKALEFYQKALPTWKVVGDRAGEASTLSNIGAVYSAFGQKQKALEYYEKALPIQKAVGDHAGAAATLTNIGAVYNALGQNQKALEYYQKALPIWEEVGDRAGAAATLNNIGGVYSTLGQKQKALEYFEKSLPIRKEVGDRVGEAATLINIGALYVDLGQKQKALEYYEKALSISQVVGHRASEAATLTNIGKLYSTLGQNQKALGYYEKALPIFQALGHRTGEATTLSNIGLVYSTLGQNQKALEHFDKALSIRQAVGDRAGVAATLNNIGGLYSGLGQKQKALEYYEKALPIQKAVGERAGEATTLTNIGAVYDALGQKQKALEYYQNAMPIWKEMGGRTGESTILNNIGGVYFGFGKKQKALEYYAKALSIRKAVGDRAGEAVTLSNIGLIYSTLGQNLKALEYYKKTLPIQRAVGDRAGEAVTLTNIGGVYSDLGQTYKALGYYEKALSIFQSMGNRFGEAAALHNIGGVYSDLGQMHQALQNYLKALPIRKAVGHRVGEAVTLTNIGAMYAELGQKQKALEYYEKALPIWRAVGDRAGEAVILGKLMAYWENLKNTQFSIFYGKQSVNAYQNLRANISKLDRMIKKNYLEIKKSAYRFLAGLLIDEGRLSEAQHVLNMLKEKEYFEFTSKDDFSIFRTYSQMDFTGFEQQWLDKYKKVTKDYSEISGDYYLLKKKKIKSDAEKKRLKELEASLEQYQKNYDRYLAKLKKAFDKYNKTVKKEKIKTPNSQKLLRERQATLKKLDEKEGGKNVFLNFLVQDERIAVIFTTAYSQFVRFSNVSNKKLNRLILEYRDAIEKRKSAPQKGANIGPLNKTIYGKLYDHIFKPVDIELKKYGATNLMIYLDGLLRYIALPVLWDGETYIVQRYRMALFTKSSLKRIDREPGEKKKILGLGATRGGEGFDPLPNVKEEIQGIVNDKEKGFNGIIPGKAFLDNDFTKETFVNQLKTEDYPLVHISSHFVFNSGGETGEESGDETKSHLLMGDGSLMNLKEIREQKGLFNRVELLMLSACETGRGDADGREIDGFGELAQQSGAQAVVASLWKVREKSTKELMVKFYQILKGGKVTSKIQALRQAQLELAGLDDLLDKNNIMAKVKNSKYSHPYYWGPFIMIGNWR